MSWGSQVLSSFQSGMQTGTALKDRGKRNKIAEILAQSYQAPQEEVPFVTDEEQAFGLPALEGNVAQEAWPGGVDMQNAFAQMYQQGLGPEAMDLEAALYKRGNEGPASVQEWRFFNSLNDNDKARFLEMKRAPSIMNLGGEYAVRSPGGGVSERYSVTPKPEQMPGFRASVTGAEERARGAAALDVERGKKSAKASEVTGTIAQAQALLDKASGGYAEAGLALGKRALGMSDETTQANEQLRLLSGWLVSNVPRMEGPQSNIDQENYKRMAGDVGNPTIPVPDRKAALKQLLALQQKYLPQQQAPKLQAGKTIDDGYIYLGGDPANPQSWKKLAR